MAIIAKTALLSFAAARGYLGLSRSAGQNPSFARPSLVDAAKFGCGLSERYALRLGQALSGDRHMHLRAMDQGGIIEIIARAM